MAKYSYSESAANAYFAEGNHMMAAAWKACGPKQRQAYLAQAVRDYCAFTGVDITQMEARGGLVPPRMDYAVFERALYLMMNSGATADGNVSGPKWLAFPPDSATATRKGNPVRPWERSEAEQRWWPIHVRVTLEGF